MLSSFTPSSATEVAGCQKHGNHRGAVQADRAAASQAARERQRAEPAGARRDPPRGRAGLQVAWPAEAVSATGTRSARERAAGPGAACSTGCSSSSSASSSSASRSRRPAWTAPASRCTRTARGLEKKRSAVHRQVPWRMEHQDSHGCRGCSNGGRLHPLSRQRARRPAGPQAHEPAAAARRRHGARHGQGT